MSNLSENRIDFVLEPVAIASNKSSLANVAKSLPKNTLTDEQRKSMPSISVENKVFTEDALAELKRKGDGIIPPFVVAKALEKDLQLFNQMHDLEGDLVSLLRDVRDIKRLAGYESYTTGLMIYKIFDVAASVGINGAKESAEKLRARFLQVGKPTLEDSDL